MSKTRKFGQKIHCPECRHEHTMETAISRWIRNHPELSSGAGYGASDQDIFWHKFRTEQGRDFQLYMQIEVKTHGGKLTESQRDTLHIVNQLMRNRKQTPTNGGTRFQAGETVLRVYSIMNRRKVWVRHFGFHVLRLSGTCPEDSDWIMWDRRLIDEETLLAILKFDVDPDEPSRPMDFRSHHRKRKPKTRSLFQDR